MRGTALFSVILCLFLQLSANAQDFTSIGQKILEDSSFFTKDFLKEINRLIDDMSSKNAEINAVGFRVKEKQPSEPAIEDVLKKYGPPEKKFDDQVVGYPSSEDVTVYQYGDVKLAISKERRDEKVFWVWVRARKQ